MDWWEMKTYIGILVCTVLLTICPQTEATFHSFGFRPGTFNSPTDHGCPPNTLFCMETKKCVNLDGTCLAPPTCHPDEVLQMMSYGLQQCVPFEERHNDDDWKQCKEGELFCFETMSCVNKKGNCEEQPTCGSQQELCNIDGKLVCVKNGSCNDMEGQKDDDWKQCKEGELFCLDTLSCVNEKGSCEAHPTCGSQQELCSIDGKLFCVEEGFCNDMEEGHKDDDWTQCKEGEFFCFDAMRCVNSKGNCEEQPTCGSQQELCSIDGQLFCVEEGFCNDMEEGHKDDDWTQCKEGEFFCFDAMRCVNSKGNCEEQPTCGSQQELCSIDGQLFCVEEGFCNDMEEGHKDDDWTQCKEGEFFCFEAMRCVNEKGNCEAQPTCGSQQELCSIDGKLFCVEEGFCNNMEEGHKDDDWKQCKEGEWFCFETINCVNEKDSCEAQPTCGSQQELCTIDGRLVCVDKGSCNVIDDSGGTGGDGCHGEGCKKGDICESDELFCIETLRCIPKGGCNDSTSDQCPKQGEEPCSDGNGSYICKPVGECADIDSLETAEVIISLDGGDSEFYKGMKDLEIQELFVSLPDQLGIHKKHLRVVGEAMDPMVALLELGPASSEDLKSYIEILMTFVNSEKIILISEKELTVSSVDIRRFPVPECELSGSCDCPDLETQCFNFEASVSISCVPKDICLPTSVCPVPKKDTASICQTECDPETDHNNVAGDLCCPNACGGGVYIGVSYMCPRNTLTGLCLTSDDIQCESGEVWCAISFSCQTANECETLAAQHSPDDTKPDQFIIRIQLKVERQDLVVFVKTTDSETDFFKEALSNLQTSVQHTLDQALASTENTVIIENVVVYPEDTDTDHLAIYANIASAKPGFVTVDDIKGMIKDLTFTSQYFPAISLVNEDDVAVVAVTGDKWLYILPEPVVAGKISTFKLQSVLPSDLFTSQTFQATLDCSGQVVEILIDGNSEDRADINSDASISIRHSHPEVELAKCRITSNQFKDISDDGQLLIGFIVLPERIWKLCAPANIDINEEVSIMTEEDSNECISLPDNLLTLKAEGDVLFEMFQNWPEKMTEAVEVWNTPGQSSPSMMIKNILQSCLISRSTAIRNLRAIVNVDQQNAAKLYYKDEALRELDIKFSFHELDICVEKDYSGSFNLSITPKLSDSSQGNRVFVPIMVIPVNDRPSKSSEWSEEVDEFAHPAVSEETTSDSTTSVFIVNKLMSKLCDDVDSNDLGMALIGSSSSTTGVVGQWDYISDELVWTGIRNIEEQNADEITVPLKLLKPEDELRFTTQEQDPWDLSHAPGLVFVCWDMSNIDVIGTDLTDSVKLTKCNDLEKEMGRYCADDEISAYSKEVIVQKLARQGCDGKLYNGQKLLRCGCGDDKTCLDCNNVPHGNAKFDACGVCGGSNTEIDCAVPACSQNKSDYCSRNSDNEDYIESTKCEEGEKPILRKYLQHCEGKRCIKTGETVAAMCDLPCEIFEEVECLDCANEVGMKNEINPCGICKPIETLYEGCESIGNIVPPISNRFEILNITLDVASSLVPDDTTEISCRLQQKEPEVSGIQVPEVILAKYVDQTTVPSLVLTLHTSTDDSSLPPFGEFAVTCEINGITVSTKNADQYLLIYDIPTLVSVTPAYALTTELSEVSITGTGIRDTKTLFCISQCLNIDEECKPKIAKGVYLSETEALCPMPQLCSKTKGREYLIHVILDDPSNVDITRLAVSNGVKFSVVMPAPTVVSAYLNKDSYNTITVKFNRKITVAEDGDCTSFFLPFEYDGAECRLPYRSKALYIMNVNKDLVDQVLQFKENVIRDAAETNTANVKYLSGSVTVQQAEPPIVEINRRIPDKIGCTAVTLKPKVRRMGHWKIDISWTVTAEDADGDHISTLQDVASQRSFQINGNQLLDSVIYNFTMTWNAGKYTGTDVVTLTKDSESSSTVFVDGIDEDYDVLKTIKFKAKFKPCDETDNNIGISWTLDPPEVNFLHRNKPFLIIRRGRLQPSSAYELSYKVTFGNGEIVTGNIAINTRALRVKAGIIYKDDTSSETIEVKHGEDLTLSCANLLAETNVIDYTCSWLCRENFLADNEDDLMPCVEIKDSEIVPLEMSGTSIALNGEDRLPPTKSFDLKQEWTVILDQNGQTSISKRKVIFKNVPIQLSVPKIKKKKNIYYVTETTKTIRIETYCRKATSYTWEASNKDELAALPLDVYKGFTTRDIQYIDRYRDCSIELDFTDISLQNGEEYGVQLHAYNTKDDEYLSRSITFYIRYIPVPLQGTITVKPAAEPIIPWSTKLIANLDDWSYTTDEIELKCHFYYRNVLDTKLTRLTTLAVSSEDELSFSLPEGEFRIEATCCNRLRGCARAETTETFQVPPEESTDILSTIEQELMMALLRVSNTLLRIAKEIKQAIKKEILDVTEAVKADKLVQDALKQAISDDLERSVDQESKLEVMQQIVDFARPADLDQSSRTALQAEARNYAREATGQGNTESKRKRRSTTDLSQPSGLTEAMAETLLRVFDSTITEESMTKNDSTVFKEAIDDFMIGLCQNFSGSEPWVARAELSYIRVQRTTLTGYASIETDVSCNVCDEVEFPATVKYGHYLETMFNNIWDCTGYKDCSDVCVATAQLNVDTVTLTSDKPIVAPTRMSDIIILKMINPETYATEMLSEMTSPIQAILTLNGTVDMDTYEYKCMMWVSDDWSDVPCNTSVPTIDSTTSLYEAVCTCNALGIISIFQQRKPDEIITTTTAISTTQADNTSPGTTTTTSATTTLPSKSLRSGTDFVAVDLTFIEDFNQNVVSESDFKNKFKQDFSSQTGINENSVRNLQVAPGSILVTFELYAVESDKTLGQMVYKIENMINSGSLTFSTPSGTPLSFKPGSFSYEEKDSDKTDKDEDTSDSNNLPIIIGGALGGLVLICVTIIIVLLIVKNKKQRTHPTNTGDNSLHAPRYNTPPPTYAVVPPPPYMYVDPPQLNKWVENELGNDKKKPVDVDEKRSSTNGSGSSSDWRIRNKVHSSAPTPVGE